MHPIFDSIILEIGFEEKAKPHASCTITIIYKLIYHVYDGYMEE